MNQAAHPAESIDFLLPRKQVEKQAGISRASSYRLIKAGKFPAPYSLNTGAVRWKQSDITAWQASLTQTA
jgi:prophage regulatory protein